jgi:predicted AlkP superfamily pyrophosphatase or phosphodiesterase
MQRLLLLLVTVSCGTPDPGPAPTADPQGPRRVLVVGIDGLRPDALMAADAPTLQTWREQGRSTLAAQTQLTADTVSGPGWASILTGVETERHGVWDNEVANLARHDVPTFLQTATDAGLATAISVQWSGAAILVEETATATRAFGDADAVADALRAQIADPTLDLIFAHFDDVDGAGHGHGFSAAVPAYVEAIEAVDAQLATVAPLLAGDDDADWLLVVATDHGGEGTGHGPRDAANRTIPLIVVYADAEPGELPPGASHLDVAPTVLDWFGLDVSGLDGVSRL